MFIELDNKERDNNYTLWRSNEDGERIRRHKLRDILPLDVPLSIDIEASSVCCLKCKYCPQSLEQSKKKDINIGQNGFMDYVLFRRLIDQLASCIIQSVDGR